MLAEANTDLPPLPSISLTPEDSWEADIPSSQLSDENKRVCGTPPTCTCMCSDTHTHNPTKNCQCNSSLIILQQPRSACRPTSRPADTDTSAEPGTGLLKVKVREIIPNLLSTAGHSYNVKITVKYKVCQGQSYMRRKRNCTSTKTLV